MRVDIVIYPSNINAAVVHLIQAGKNPTLKNTRELIKEMVTANGEVWTTEPGFWGMEIDEKVDFETATKMAEEIAPKYYDKII